MCVVTSLVDWIRYFAGIALLINNITGPGVPQLPNMFAEAGWLLPTILIIAIWIMTSTSTVMYCEAMRKIPGNEHFRGACNGLYFRTSMSIEQVLIRAIRGFPQVELSLLRSLSTTSGTARTPVPRSVSMARCSLSTLSPLSNLHSRWTTQFRASGVRVLFHSHLTCPFPLECRLSPVNSTRRHASTRVYNYYRCVWLD